MAPKPSAGASASSGGAAAVPASSSIIQPSNGSRPLPSSFSPSPVESVSQDSQESVGMKRQSTLPALLDSSPKKMVRKISNVMISEWMERCPNGSPPGSTGTGSTYAVLISQQPVELITTKKDQRRVSKKSITVGDHSGHTAEISIWGAFAARSWM